MELPAAAIVPGDFVFLGGGRRVRVKSVTSGFFNKSVTIIFKPPEIGLPLNPESCWSCIPCDTVIEMGSREL